MTLTVGNNRKQALELLRLSALIEKDNLENDIAIAKLIIKEIKRRRNRPCRVWVRPWILRRQRYGVYENPWVGAGLPPDGDRRNSVGA